MKEMYDKQVVEFLRNVAKDKIFSMIYKRIAPKCASCGKSNKKWEGIDVCPHCGGQIMKYRFATCKLGVTDPKHTTKPGEGKFKGESFEDALADGRLKYFDMNVENEDGTKGNYRQCKIENIREIRTNGQVYWVKNEETQEA